MDRSYQFTAKKGDIVQMPNGTVGIISGIDLSFGHSKEVFVFPFTNWLHRMLLVFRNKTHFSDRAISNLKIIHAAS